MSDRPDYGEGVDKPDDVVIDSINVCGACGRELTALDIETGVCECMAVLDVEVALR